MVLMNKMLELMEEHFSEGDYVEGSKMIKSLYDDREYEEEIDELEGKLSNYKEWNKKIQEDYIKTQEDYIIVLEEKGDLLEIITLLRVQNKLLRENNLLKEIRKC